MAPAREKLEKRIRIKLPGKQRSDLRYMIIAIETQNKIRKQKPRCGIPEI